MRRDWQLDIAWNVRWFRRISRHSGRSPLLDATFRALTPVGKGWTAALLIPIFFFAGGPGAAIALTSALVLTGLVVLVLKRIFRHRRPTRLLDGVHNPEGIHARSFPSGDAAYAWCVFAASSSVLAPVAQGLLGALALLIAVGRIYRGVHFPLDVAVGAAIGAGFGAAIGHPLVERTLTGLTATG